jgi:hypothetical protein
MENCDRDFWRDFFRKFCGWRLDRLPSLKSGEGVDEYGPPDGTTRGRGVCGVAGTPCRPQAAHVLYDAVYYTIGLALGTLRGDTPWEGPASACPDWDDWPATKRALDSVNATLLAPRGSRTSVYPC